MNWRGLFGWSATLLYVVFGGNVVLAKLSSVSGMSMPYLGDHQEFFMLLLATAAFIGFALCEEARKPDHTPTAGDNTAKPPAGPTPGA